MVKRLVVGAHYGLRDWLAQRATATYMALYTIVFAFAALTLPKMDYEHWSALFSGGLMRFLTFLFFMSLAYHAWVGVRDIWMDYIKPAGIRLALQVFAIVWLLGCAGWAVQVIWRL